MQEYLVNLEIERPGALSEDQQDHIFNDLTASNIIIDPILSIGKNNSMRLSYSIDCDDATDAFEAGLSELDKVLPRGERRVVEIVSKPYSDKILDEF